MRFSPKVRYTQFDPASLLELLTIQYDLPDGTGCIFFKSGLNDIYKLTDGEETYFFRLSLCGVHTTAAVEEEIDTILRLRARGLSVVEPIACRNHTYVWEIEAPEGARQAVLFRGIGQNPAGDATIRMSKLGALIAGMHLAGGLSEASTVRPLIDETMLVEEPVKLLTPYLRRRPGDLDYLNRTGRALWRQIDALLLSCGDAVGFCHGDVQPNNFFFQGEEPILFDFDCMGVGHFAYDLGVLLANLTFVDNDMDQKPLWNAVLEGYAVVRPLSGEERRAVYIFAALHMLRVLAYHAKLREQNQGAFYYMTDSHLDMIFGAYKRLTELAVRRTGISLL